MGEKVQKVGEKVHTHVKNRENEKEKVKMQSKMSQNQKCPPNYHQRHQKQKCSVESSTVSSSWGHTDREGACLA